MIGSLSGDMRGQNEGGEGARQGELSVVVEVGGQTGSDCC